MERLIYHLMLACFASVIIIETVNKNMPFPPVRFMPCLVEWSVHNSEFQLYFLWWDGPRPNLGKRKLPWVHCMEGANDDWEKGLCSMLECNSYLCYEIGSLFQSWPRLSLLNQCWYSGKGLLLHLLSFLSLHFVSHDSAQKTRHCLFHISEDLTTCTVQYSTHSLILNQLFNTQPCSELRTIEL